MGSFFVFANKFIFLLMVIKAEYIYKNTNLTNL